MIRPMTPEEREGLSICKDCVYCSNAGQHEDYFVCTIARAFYTIDYVQGTISHKLEETLCSIHNTDGLCKAFKKNCKELLV